MTTGRINQVARGKPKPHKGQLCWPRQALEFTAPDSLKTNPQAPLGPRLFNSPRQGSFHSRPVRTSCPADTPPGLASEPWTSRLPLGPKKRSGYKISSLSTSWLRADPRQEKPLHWLQPTQLWDHTVKAVNRTPRAAIHLKFSSGASL